MKTRQSPARNDSPAGISAKNLTKRYGKVEALRGVGFDVAPGTVFGLLGPNGAGKSTTIRLLTTLSRPDAGLATVAGYDVATQARAVRRTIGVVAQGSGSDMNATGRENLWLQGRLHGLPASLLRDRSSRLLARLGLSDAADRMVRQWSGGMVRRLDLAMGLIHQPAVLFLDEPTVGLDPEIRRALWEDVEQLIEKTNISVLLTTHYLDEADRLASEIAILDQGQIVAHGSPSELKRGLDGDGLEIAISNHTAATSAVAVVEAIDGISGVHFTNGSLMARAVDGAELLPGVLATLTAKGLSVASAHVTRPSLDDAYLEATGRRINSSAEVAS